MAKYLKDVLGKNTTTKKTNDLGVYKPKAGDEQKFAKKHEIEVHDHTPAPETQFSGGKSEAAYNKQSDGVYESKKAEDVSCNHTPAGTKCPLHEMADCSTVRNIKELSTDLLHRAAHKAAKVAMTDVQGRSGPIFKKRAAQANKFRDKGMAQEKKEKAAKAVKEENLDEAGRVLPDLSKPEPKGEHSKDYLARVKKQKDKTTEKKTAASDYLKMKGSLTKEEAIDELSKKTLGRYIQGASRDLATRQYNLGKGDKSNTGKIMNRRKGIDKAADKLTNEGANVDRMVAHVKSSEKAAGKSDKKAESIAWATANKRGMLDNKNKKMEESIDVIEDVQDIAKKYKDYVSGGGTPDTASRYKSHVNMLSKKTGQHPDAINKQVKKHVKKMNEDLAVPLLQGDSHSDEAVEMVKAELKALANKALHLVMQMPSSMHVEPWCQAKIANAKSYVNDVHDYMIYGDHKEEDEQTDTPMDITTASNPPNTSPNFAADVDTGRNV